MRRWAFFLLWGAGCAAPSLPDGPLSSPNVIFLRDLDSPAAEALERAIERRDWGRAAIAAGRILEDEEFVPLGEKGESFVGAAVHPRHFVMRRLAGAPAELVEECRRRWDAAAQREVEAGLTRLSWERFWICTGMDHAGNRLAGELIEEGRPMEAFEIWRTILLYVPDTTLPRELLAARALHAAAAAGESAWMDTVPDVSGTVIAVRRPSGVAELRERLAAACPPKAPVQHDLRTGFQGPEGVAFTLYYGPRPEMSDVAYAIGRGGHETVLLTVPSLYRVMSLYDVPPLEFVLLHSEHRLLWICGGRLAGLLELDTLRQVWTGPPEEAPVPASWRERANALSRGRPGISRSEAESYADAPAIRRVLSGNPPLPRLFLPNVYRIR